jgi:hypothetical protein
MKGPRPAVTYRAVFFHSNLRQRLISLSYRQQISLSFLQIASICQFSSGNTKTPRPAASQERRAFLRSSLEISGHDSNQQKYRVRSGDNDL